MPRTLSEADADLFYQLFFPLLGYVNEKHRIVPGLRHIMPGMSIRAEDAKEIADKLWEDPGLIDRYLAERTLPEDRRSILLSWKKRRKDEFFVERHLAGGSIFSTRMTAPSVRSAGSGPTGRRCWTGALCRSWSTPS